MAGSFSIGCAEKQWTKANEKSTGYNTRLLSRPDESVMASIALSALNYVRLDVARQQAARFVGLANDQELA